MTFSSKLAMAGFVFLVLIGFITAQAYRFLHRTPGDVFNSAGLAIHYTDKGEGATVILLHGFAVNGDINWRLPGVTKTLSHSHRVISMDLRGHGLSAKPKGNDDYGIEMADDVIRLMDALNIEKAHLVGYSLGGVISLKLATMHPDRFWTVNPLGAGWESETDGVFFKAAPAIAGSLERGEGVPPLSKFLGGERRKPGLVHTYWVKIVSRYLNDGPALAAMVRQLSELTITRDELAQIDLHICSIVGENDSMKAGVDAMQGVAPNLTTHVISGRDHISALRAPEFMPALRSCLGSATR